MLTQNQPAMSLDAGHGAPYTRCVSAALDAMSRLADACRRDVPSQAAGVRVAQGCSGKMESYFMGFFTALGLVICSVGWKG